MLMIMIPKVIWYGGFFVRITLLGAHILLIYGLHFRIWPWNNFLLYLIFLLCEPYTFNTFLKPILRCIPNKKITSSLVVIIILTGVVQWVALSTYSSFQSFFFILSSACFALLLHAAPRFDDLLAWYRFSGVPLPDLWILTSVLNGTIAYFFTSILPTLTVTLPTAAHAFSSVKASTLTKQHPRLSFLSSHNTPLLDAGLGRDGRIEATLGLLSFILWACLHVFVNNRAQIRIEAQRMLNNPRNTNHAATPHTQNSTENLSVATPVETLKPKEPLSRGTSDLVAPVPLSITDAAHGPRWKELFYTYLAEETGELVGSKVTVCMLALLAAINMLYLVYALQISQKLPVLLMSFVGFICLNWVWSTINIKI